MRCQVRITGWMPPRPRPRPGSVTSSASSARRAASLASASSARRASRACSIRCLAALNFAPSSLRDSAGTDLRAACRAVSSPAFPRTRAFAFSRDAASPAALNAASARETMPSRSCNLVGEAGLDLARDLRERGLVRHREIGQHLAVDVDVRALQPGHEARVGHAQLAHRGVDARDPQRADHALLGAAVAVGILARLHHRLLGHPVDVLPAAAEPLRLLQYLLVARARLRASLDSRHGALLTTSTAASTSPAACCCGGPRWCRAAGASSWCSSW